MKTFELLYALLQNSLDNRFGSQQFRWSVALCCLKICKVNLVLLIESSLAMKAMLSSLSRFNRHGETTSPIHLLHSLLYRLVNKPPSFVPIDKLSGNNGSINDEKMKELTGNCLQGEAADVLRLGFDVF